MPQELRQCNKTNTKLGFVVVLGFSVPIPEGWDRLLPEEGRMIKSDLEKILTQWSIVAFQFGAMTGPGYGCTINDSYGT